VTAALSKRLAAEVIGTFGFFFTGFCGIAALTTQPSGAILSIGVAAGFGFGLALMIFAFGHISGGHYNPAVTLGLTVARRFPAKEILPYWAAQIVGGLGASAVLRALFTKTVLSDVRTLPGVGISSGRALGLEIVFTFLFLLVITTLATDKRAPWNGVFAPFGIGLFIFTAATVCGPMSGGSFNPARSITPAILDGNFASQWIYIVGPLAGAAIGGFVHSLFREPERRPEAGQAVSTP
jgi:MIP family channel proteins